MTPLGSPCDIRRSLSPSGASAASHSAASRRPTDPSLDRLEANGVRTVIVERATA